VAAAALETLLLGAGEGLLLRRSDGEFIPWTYQHELVAVLTQF
jgi:hypothetical protein